MEKWNTIISIELTSSVYPNVQVPSYMPEEWGFDARHILNEQLVCGEYNRSAFKYNITDLLRDELLAKNAKFLDSEFAERRQNTVNWQRISTIKGAVLFDVDVTPGDVNQGSLGDCWLLSALASAAAKHSNYIIDSIHPSTINPLGFYMVKLRAMYGDETYYVLIDDWLPFNADGTLKYCKAKQNVFWAAVMEKAIAKLMVSNHKPSNLYFRVDITLSQPETSLY